jgi:hypothetical protein
MSLLNCGNELVDALSGVCCHLAQIICELEKYALYALYILHVLSKAKMDISNIHNTKKKLFKNYI